MRSVLSAPVNLGTIAKVLLAFGFLGFFLRAIHAAAALAGNPQAHANPWINASPLAAFLHAVCLCALYAFLFTLIDRRSRAAVSRH